MSNFIRLPSSVADMHFDASNIKGVLLQRINGKETVGVYLKDEPTMILDQKNWGVDVDVLLDTLDKAGKRLFPFPVRVEGSEFNLHFQPKDVQYATMTAEKDGKVNIIMGVEGVGRIKGHDMPVAQWQALYGAILASDVTMKHYDSEMAVSRWFGTPNLFINPQAITRIHDDGTQVNVTFGKDDKLDIQIPEKDEDLDIDAMLKKGMSEGDIMKEAYKEKDRISREARHAFALGLAEGLTHLVRVPSEDRVVFIQPDDVKRVSLRADKDFSLSLEFNAHRTLDDFNLHYKTAEERDVAFKVVTQAPPK